MRISDWSSDVCSSDLTRPAFGPTGGRDGTSEEARHRQGGRDRRERDHRQGTRSRREDARLWRADRRAWQRPRHEAARPGRTEYARGVRSEEHTSELQSLMRISYAVFCLKKKNTNTQ